MARITIEDCQEHIANRFLLVQTVIKRIKQYRNGHEALVPSRNKEVVTALREIAQGLVRPEPFEGEGIANEKEQTRKATPTNKTIIEQ